MRALIVGLLALAVGLPSSASELVVYSERKEQLLQPLLEQFKAETGITVRLLTDQAAVLIERIAAEGASTRADLLVTVDAGGLYQAAERGLLLPLQSELLDAAIPAHLRDAEGRWFGLSLRARSFVYDSRKLSASELGSYADLADPKWRGKLCLRSSAKVYNQSLVAMMLARLGEAETERIVRGWVANLAAPPFADDSLAISAVVAGRCQVALVNSYYLGRMQKDNPRLPAQLHFADQDGAGTHVNISGAAVVKASKKPAQAQQLLEWLASDRAQELFAAANLEFPAKPGIAVDPVVAAWGSFRQDATPVAESGRRQADAVKLMDRAGWR